MTEPSEPTFTLQHPPIGSLPVDRSLPRNTIEFRNELQHPIATITPDGIMHFTVDPTDENAAAFINCIETFLSTRINGIVVKGAKAPVDFMDECRQIAAQCWCAESTQHLTMIPELAEAFARVLSQWMGVAAQHLRNESFYRGLLDKVAAELGPVRRKAFISDDGSIQIDPIRLKIPELVAELADAADNWLLYKEHASNEQLAADIIAQGKTYNVPDGNPAQ